SGKVYHDAQTDAELPAVGDWVALDLGSEDVETMIRARLTRQTCFSRRAPGESAEEQVIAANVSIVTVVTDAGLDFNLRRMERYFALIGRSGAQALVLINKADLFTDEEIHAAVETIRALHADLPVLVTSVKKKTGLAELKKHLNQGISMAFVGSSGVGKSALINLLLGGEYQWTGEVNEVTGKGRHTTTARELLVLRKGGIIIDNPGIKEVQMWTDETTLRERFVEVERLAGQCKFHDCKHGKDSGCAVRAAVEDGTLDAGRFAGFLKLDEEIAKLRARRKKRLITVDRRAKRNHKVKARNPSDRADLNRDLRPMA
ncbi:MAG: ribosome small subunit-dependent GTPase A, partial [Verrucomicrobiaceae bacterium]